MKRMVFVLGLIIFQAYAAQTNQGNTATATNYSQWVEYSLRSIQQIKPGMTRADLESLFVAEGGISTRAQRTYVFRECHYFKVDFEFEPGPSDSSADPQSDKIIRMSRPYLDWPISD